MEKNIMAPKECFGQEFLEALRELKSLDMAAVKLVKERGDKLLEARAGMLPDYLNDSRANMEPWKISLPEWCQDQRNQMTGPADNSKLVVKLLNSGSPGVMLDIEDSMKNGPEELLRGLRNAQHAMNGDLSYEKESHVTTYGSLLYEKKGEVVCIKKSDTVVFVRPRGMHLTQELTDNDGETLNVCASIFDVLFLFWDIDLSRLSHPPIIYIPKSESAIEGLWWDSFFKRIEKLKDWPENTIRCMALVESHPLAYEIEEFSFNLRHRILGLNLGRWDYLASLFDYMYNQDGWTMPDRNTIPLDVPFFQNLRMHLAYVCHKHGMLAIGGMTALYPSRKNAELNDRALERLKVDKENEASCFMDGAWTGHPDQNEIAVAAFPAPSQIDKLPNRKYSTPNLREFKRVGKMTIEGIEAAIRTCITYRLGVLKGKGAFLIDGYMEDLATDRIYRVLICQRIDKKLISKEVVGALFFNITEQLMHDYSSEYLNKDWEAAREATWKLIKTRQFNPV